MGKIKNFLSLVLSLTFILFFNEIGLASQRVPVKLEGKNILPLRVLSKPFSSIYLTKDLNGEIVEENIPAFRAFYVYTRPEAADMELGNGWYEVGSDNRGTVIGWMKQDDLFEWKQALCLVYTNPNDRQPVLMFESRSFSKNLVEKPQDERIAATKELHNKIDAKEIDKNFPVVSVEPKKAVDITKEFYLLPILEYEVIELDNREGRLLKLAAVTNAGATAREKSDIRTNKEFLTQVNEESTLVDAKKLKDVKVDIVWVIDTTASMQPYIDKTIETVQKISESISNDKDVKDAVKFGIWGYRDSVEEVKALEYTTKNYTPKLQSIDDFASAVSQVKAINVSSQGYEEDLFSGIADAIDKTAWTEGAMRFIILAGDAPSHPAGHKLNSSKMDENSLHNLAIDRKISISAIHLKNPKAEKFHELTKTQMSTLATNPGVEEPAYYEMDSSDLEQFAAVSANISKTINASLSNILKGANLALTKNQEKQKDTERTEEKITSTNDNSVIVDDFLESEPQKTDTIAAEKSPKDSSSDITSQVVKAAVVQWLGSQTGAQAPRDITAWAVDKDFADPSISSMEVRLLLTKRQLDTLYQVLTSVLNAGQQGQISGGDFFDALQSTAATAARDPELLKKAKNMASAGLIPEFLEGLPYHSQLMDMSNELWSSWSVDEQNDFLNNLNAIIEAYKIIHDSPEGWIQLNPNDDADMAVYPLSLEMLP